MTNEDGLIVCKNTMDARLELAYQSMLPTIRKTLYDE
jgi:vacuolar-type H+-ATPase subunit E/Vma4